MPREHMDVRSGDGQNGKRILPYREVQGCTGATTGMPREHMDVLSG